MARILILRPEADALETADVLRVRGHTPLILPLHRTEPVLSAVPAAPVAGFLVTSSNAVPRLASAFEGDRRLILAVGERTAARLRGSGFGNVVVGEGTAAGLVSLARALADAASLPLLYAAGRVRSAGIEDELAAAGVPLLVWEVYDTMPAQPTSAAIGAAFAGAAVDAVLVLSVGQAKAFTALAASESGRFTPMPCLLCLSERIRDGLSPELRGSASISPQPELSSLFDRYL